MGNVDADLRIPIGGGDVASARDLRELIAGNQIVVRVGPEVGDVQLSIDYGSGDRDDTGD